MLDFACRSSCANAISLERGRAAALGLYGSILGEFGVTVDKRMLTVAARELPAPVVPVLRTCKVAAALGT